MVLIMADDQGWGDLSIHGNTNLSTPHIDSLGQDGAIFDRFYVGPVCSPTRAELLTGRYYPRGGVHGTSAGSERLNLDERTIAETFQAAGYATGAFGKWHNGSQPPYHPNYRGFDEYYGIPSGHWGHYYDYFVDHNGEITRGKGYLTDDFTNHAISFIDQNKERPFFVYVPYNTPHSPMQVPAEYWAKFDGGELGMRNRDPERENIGHTLAALAMVENIDWNVGRILDKLDELRLADDTIVIYMSDNGPNGYRWNGDMKGRKGAIDEGGVRVPSLWRWKGTIPAGLKIEEIAGAIDLLPTLADMADVEIVGDKPLDGKSVKPLLLDTAENWPDREIVSFQRGRVSVRNQRFRLDADGRLFDIGADPGQRTDVAAERPEVVEKLSAIAKAMEAEYASNWEHDDRPFPVGFGEVSWLPARDAKTEGGLERSNRFPNSSYFLNWKSTEDAVTWDVEVGEAGDYDVTLYYAALEGKTGSTVELSMGESTLAGKVEPPHDPPLLGAEDDRVPRAEGYVKDFRPLELGTIGLEEGRGELRLRATEIPNGEVMEFWSLILKKR